MKRILLVLVINYLLIIAVKAQLPFQTKWQNRTRTALLYLPTNFSPAEKLPLVINMHGFLTTSQFQFDYTQFHKTADTARCIVLYPDGVDLRWNSGTFFFVSSTIDDVGFLGDWMDRAAVLYNADLSKVYAMGYSAGGFMSYKLACDLTNRVAAIAPDVASMVYDNLSTCAPARPMNIASFNGLSDPITAYGGFPGNFPGIDSVKHFWQIKNGCNELPLIDTLPDLRVDGTRVVRYTYQNCAQNVEQVYYKVINGGHVWPGASNIFFDVLGKTTLDISMNTEVWKFFKTKSIPQNVICDAPADLQSYNITADSVLLNWQGVPGILNYKVGIADDSNRVTFYETFSTSFGIKINPSRPLRWNVASLCSSGFHNWNTTKPLNFTPTLIRNNTNTNNISIYPNPCTATIVLDSKGKSLAGKQVIIYNTFGEIVLKIADLSANQIDVSFLSKGCYQLVLTDNTDTTVVPFVKQ